jgi:hypothetical protein
MRCVPGGSADPSSDLRRGFAPVEVMKRDFLNHLIVCDPKVKSAGGQQFRIAAGIAPLVKTEESVSC